jgi:DNA-binding transcriptional LysR family regulator
MATLRALECLVAVLETGSVSRAAVALHMSQPALSHQLAVLEREIGTPAFERLPRGVLPTVAGRAMEADARAALMAAERVVATGRAVAHGSGGELRIACAESMTVGLLAPVIRRWLRRTPDVRLSLTELTSADALAAAVVSGEADIAIGPRPSRWEGSTGVIGQEEVVVAMARTDPLAPTVGPIGYGLLAGQPVVHYHPDNGLGEWIDRIAAEHGVTLTAVTRTRQATTAAQLAAAGLGVALVPTTALPPSFSGALRRLEPPLTRAVLTMVANRTDTLVRRFEADVRRRGVPLPKPVAAQLADGDRSEGTPQAGSARSS